MKFLKAQRAIETLEAAITFPIAILVMLATVNLGMVVYGQQAVQAAARHGARMGSVAQQCSACYAVSAASSAINGDPIVKQPNVAILSPGGVAGSILTVRVSRSPALQVPCRACAEHSQQDHHDGNALNQSAHVKLPRRFLVYPKPDRPELNSKFEYRNSKQIQMRKSIGTNES